MNIDIMVPQYEEGYKVQHRFGAWRVAYLTYADHFDNITYLERHMETDEIFILVEGTATLLIGEKAEPCEMIKNNIYNIPKGEWHNIRVSKNAVVIIIENEDTSKDNSEYMDFDR